MKPKRILFPTDFSPASAAALEYASSLARDSGATLLIVHVEEPITNDVFPVGYHYVPIPDINALH